MALPSPVASDATSSKTNTIERYYVYVLQSQKDFNLYTGFTTNLKRRLSEHAREGVLSTVNRRPLTLIHYEYFINREDAEARERFLKSGFGRNQLKEALKRTLPTKNPDTRSGI